MDRISQWQFDMYALSRDRGHDFQGAIPRAAFIADNGSTLAALTLASDDRRHGLMIWRRRADGVWQHERTADGYRDVGSVMEVIVQLVDDTAEPLPIPPGVAPRPELYDFGAVPPPPIFAHLMNAAHFPAAWVLKQAYLALPRPDPNWASDARTGNFHTRLWEAYLLASFREQGLLVSQPHEAPDFRVEAPSGEVAWVEAVTANAKTPYEHVNAPFAEFPQDKEALFFGPAAVRFAKTLGNKLQKGYAKREHVSGSPFVIAIADFHAGGSMVWSREALLAYLMGAGARTELSDGKKIAVPWERSHLLGPSEFPAGLFTDDRNAELSAIVFSNACTIAKFNRIGVTGHGAPAGYRYTRFGRVFDTRPGALDGIPFCLDITNPEYLSWWHQGYEPWSAEMEVIHNPFAEHPISLDMFAEATHWFMRGEEWVSTQYYQNAVLWSRTMITSMKQRPPTLSDVFTEEELGSGNL